MAVQTQIVPPTGTSAPGTSFAGPVMSGSRSAPHSPRAPPNQGLCLLMQEMVLVHNGTNVVNASIALPKHSVIVDIISDTTTAWNSATSDTLSVGVSTGDTTYASGVDVKGGTARLRPAFTAAQLLAMQ